jgi:GntR family negative regulator for fad regulon and positive regulator of fabA
MTTYQLPSKRESSWQPIPKPAEIVEQRIIQAILDGKFAINSFLPGERDLAEMLGVTRPTLRESLQRLARDGWIEIHQGKHTRVRDYWKEGKLGVLNALPAHVDHLPQNFVLDLLNVRLALAPVYTSLAVSNAPHEVIRILQDRENLDESPVNYTQFDWDLQHGLTLLSGNTVFVMILNGFKELFLFLAPRYFQISEARKHSLQYYQSLNDAASDCDVTRAKLLTEEIMRESIQFWKETV